jgi:hypothetical protein
LQSFGEGEVMSNNGLTMLEAYALQDTVNRVGIHRVLVELDKICAEAADKRMRQAVTDRQGPARLRKVGNEIMACAGRVDAVLHGELLCP